MSDAIEAALLPCPFCGGAAEWYDISEDDEVGNAGGSCITCTKCQACGPVQFGEKDTIIEQWNRRPAITAYEAAKGGGVASIDGLPPGIRAWEYQDADGNWNLCGGSEHKQSLEREAAFYGTGPVTFRPLYALTSPASGGGMR